MPSDRNGANDGASRVSTMTREDLVELAAYLRSGSRVADSTVTNVVSRSEYRVMLGVAALILALLTGSGAFLFDQLMSLERTMSSGNQNLVSKIADGDKELLKAIGEVRSDLVAKIGDRLTEDDLERLREDIRERDKRILDRLDEIAAEVKALYSEDTEIHQRIGALEKAAKNLANTERD